jgi:ADP-ribose pyrophosphatase YjhB (NUDIX family)
MRYCSACGHEVARRWIAEDGRERYVCEACGATHYENPRIIVCCIAHLRDEILLCRRAHQPGRGQWSLPSGYLECGETLEAAAAREMLEETGLILDPAKLELYAVTNMTEIDQVAVTFRTRVEHEPALSSGAECLEVAFLSEEEAAATDVAWRESSGDGAEKFFEELRAGAFTIHLATLGCPEKGTQFASRNYALRSSRLTFRRARINPEKEDIRCK